MVMAKKKSNPARPAPEPRQLKRIVADLGPPLGETLIVETDQSDPVFTPATLGPKGETPFFDALPCAIRAAELICGIKMLEVEALTYAHGTVSSDVAGEAAGAMFVLFPPDAPEHGVIVVPPPEDGGDVAMAWVVPFIGESQDQ